jgi:hypothetical protein
MSNHAAVDMAIRELAKAEGAFVAVRASAYIYAGEEPRAAAMQAAEDWRGHRLDCAPHCWACEFIGAKQSGPLGTGDSPSARDCAAYTCPWGK